MNDDDHRAAPTLDDESQPVGASPSMSAAQAEDLMHQALAHPDLHPAVTAVLTPLIWYMEHLQRRMDRWAAPMRWVSQLKDQVETQGQDKAAWHAVVQANHWQARDDAPHAVTQYYGHNGFQPRPGWNRMADVDAGELGRAGMTIWAHPGLKAIVTAHEEGEVFVSHYATAKAFGEALRTYRAPTQEKERE